MALGLHLSFSTSPLRHPCSYKQQMSEKITELAIIEMHKAEEALQAIASSADMAVTK